MRAHLCYEARSGVTDATGAAAAASVLQRCELASQRPQPQKALVAEVVGDSQRLQPGQALQRQGPRSSTQDSHNWRTRRLRRTDPQRAVMCTAQQLSG